MKIKIKHAVLVSVLFLFSHVPVACAAGDKIEWHDFEKGLALAKKEKKKVYLHFYADWCRYCTVMNKNTFNNPVVVNYLKENFISIRVNSDKKKKIAAKFKVQGLPANWFLSENGLAVDYRPGYLAPDAFLPLLKKVTAMKEKKSAQPVKWRSYKEGVEMGKKENKKVFLYFYTEKDPYCDLMENTSFKDPMITEYINNNFIPVKSDLAKNKDRARTFGIQKLPSMWFITGSGEKIGGQPGHLPPEMLVNVLRYIGTDSYKRIKFKDFLETM